MTQVNKFRQVRTPFGHVVYLDADLLDGHALFEITFTDILTIDGPAGASCTGKLVYLNNCLVKDPTFAAQLWREAMTLRLQP